MARHVLIPPLINPVAPPKGTGPQDIALLQGETMGTSWSVRFVCPPGLHVPALLPRIDAVFARIIDQMSSWVPGSVLSRFNGAALGTRFDLPDDFFTVLEAAVTLAEETGGAFDPAMGALTALWGFGPGEARGAPPSPEEIATARARCGWRRLSFDRHARTLTQAGGVQLDLSGIAKGYAVDRLGAALEVAGIHHYLAEIGGELKGRGVKPDGTPWWAALERPPGFEETGEYIAALHGLSVATSGDYIRYFERGGVRYAHTLDPRSGMPAAHGVAAITVLHESCMRADALATALGVMGLDEGMAFARAKDIAALFLLRGQAEEHMSPAFAAMLE